MVVYKEYEPEVLKHLQEVELMILKDVIEVLDKHNLKYYTIAGSAIGAVRHGGFIPWDDDIDIAMFREDYDKAIPILEKELSEKYNVFELNKDENYFFAITKVSLKGTKLVEHHLSNFNLDLGIFIDIFPMDKIPKSDFLGKVHHAMFKFIYTIVINSHVKIFTDSFIKRTVHYGLYYLLKILPVSLNKWKKLLHNVMTHYSKDQSGRYTEFDTICGFIAFTKDDFEPSVKFKFEDMEVVLPKNYDKLLKKVYGDYMELPPVEKRYNHAPDLIDFGKY